MNSQPVFFDPHGRRKRVFSRGVLVTIGISVLISFVFTLTVLFAPFAPLPAAKMPHQHGNHEVKRGILPARSLETPIAKKLGLTKLALVSLINQEAQMPKKPLSQAGAPIVAAFYAPWQEAGLYSLRASSTKITHLMPQWLHLKADGHSVDYETDFDPIITPKNTEVMQIANDNGIRLLPVLDNYVQIGSGDQGGFDHERASKLLSSAVDQQLVANQLRDWLLEQRFMGINLDFEELDAKDYQKLPDFVQRLQTAFKPAGLRVTMDIEAGNDNVPLKRLGELCDWVVLMAYDEHDENHESGPIASVQWSEQEIQKARKLIDPSKLVCGIGNYGYDWTQGKLPADSITYQEALDLAEGYRDLDRPQDVIRMDPASLNLTFEYDDDNNRKHVVWLLDAVTAYNKIKLGQRYDLRGYALWALGSEDPAIWDFFDRNRLNLPQNPQALSTIEFPYEVDYVGEGEVLDVLRRANSGSRTIKVDPQLGLITDETYQKYPSSIVIRRSGFQQKTLALTFDDGPDERYTPMILDELERQGVKATFFLVGKNAEQFPGLVRRMVDEGHEVGNHTFTHPNLGAASDRRIELEINATQRAIESITGRSTILFRPPYNADAEPTDWSEVWPILKARSMGYLTIGELIDPEDWLLQVPQADGTLKRRTSADIVQATYADLPKGNVILLHDAGGDRLQTVLALRKIIPALKDKGYKFVTISQLAGMSYNQVMPPVPADQRVVLWIDRMVFDTVFGLESFLAVAFLLAIGLGLGRVAMTTVLAVYYESRKRWVQYPDTKPSVAVLVAAFNEQTVIGRTIQAALASEYPVSEVVVVDDGSKDGTGDMVEQLYGDNPLVRLIRQENTGKAGALNRAIEMSTAEIIVCVDADTQLDHRAIGLLARHFADDEVAAVAGNVRVGNEVNLLTKWQSIEYTTSQNLDRRAYALLNSITVCPGAISAWRRSVVTDLGGYMSDTLAEDMDLTWRVREQGWQMETESGAIAYTEAPASIKPFFKQRFRWAYGTLQCLWKHKRSLFHHGFFGWMALPSLWLFQVIFQALAPLVDIQLLYSLWGYLSAWLVRDTLLKDYQPLAAATNALEQVLFLYVLFVVVEAIGGVIAYRLDKRKAGPVVWLFWQRFVYRQIMYAVIYKALATALGGVRQGWGKIDRKATVNLPTTFRGG